MKATVFSVFNNNIDPEVAKAQKECVSRFLPGNWKFRQICHGKSHGEMLKACVDDNTEEYSIFLDVDCIPLHQTAFSYFFGSRWSMQSGALMGAAQRASHINNGGHLYVGPFCMGFQNSVYRELGSPDFIETYRGDVGEELTYRWQEKNRPVYFLYPSSVEAPLWNLVGKIQFGIGTSYEDLFYHAFNIRVGAEPKDKFLKKCKEVIQTYDSQEQLTK